jgi:putative endonuclease
MFLELKAVDYPHAIRMEKHIKKMKSKVFIQNLKKYPELRKKLFQRTTYT